MTDSTISALPAASALGTADLIEVVQAGASKKATAGQVAALVVGQIPHPGYVSGRWYCPIVGATLANGTTGPQLAVITLTPIQIFERVTLQALAGRVTTASAGGVFALAIYAHNPATGKATGNPLASALGLSTAAAGAISAALAANVTLDPGTYWAAFQADNATARLQGLSFAQSVHGALVGSATLANITSGSATAAFASQVTNTYGSFPDLTSAAIVESTQYAPPTAFLQIA